MPHLLGAGGSIQSAGEEMLMPHRLGIDLAARRASFVLSGEAAGAAHAVTLPVAEGRLASTISSGVSELIRQSNIEGAAVDRVVVALPTDHTGANGVRVGLLVTRGFEQKLALTGGPDQGRFTRGIDERVLASGNVLIQIDEDAARQSVNDLVAQQVETVAICLMHANRNPNHELRLREIVQEQGLQAPVILSHEVTSESGEAGRARATTLAAAARIDTKSNLLAVADGLADAGLKPPLDVMQSTGERLGAELVSDTPEKTLFAGCSSAAAAAARATAEAGQPDAMLLDVSADAALGTLIRRGLPRMASDKVVAGQNFNLLSLDVQPIADGLGAVATAPLEGTIRIGEETAQPTGLGGDGRPTVMDALVILGRLPADTLTLDIERAEDAIAGFAASLGLDLHRAAEGIVSIYCEILAGELRRIAIRKGEVPSRLVLVAGGSGGPVLATEIARLAGFGIVIIPDNAGHLSAFGCATAGKSNQFAVGLGRPLDVVDTSHIAQLVSELNARAKEWLAAEDADGGGQISFRAELAYPGSHLRCSVALEADAIQDREKLTAILAGHAEKAYKKKFGAVPAQPPELSSIRLIATAEGAKPPKAAEPRHDDPRPALKEQRQVWFNGGFQTASVFDAGGLSAGNRIIGPALISQRDTTIIVEPGMAASVDGQMNVIIGEGS